MRPGWLSNAYVVADAEGTAPVVILRTHAHHDHVAFEDELRERLGVPVVAEPGE
jgi:glyoxylase-like metal-dependent hydrolase (beta-lactamase superfamily II)